MSGVAVIALSSSRTSFVGLAVVLAYLGGRQLTATRLVRTIVLMFILVGSVLSVDARARSMVAGFVGGDRLDDAAVAFQRGSEGVVSANEAAADVNIIKRFGVWGEASRSWMVSPLVGSGPFRLNDRNVERSAPLPGVSLVTSGDRVYSDFGAHNLVLQLAADGGVALLVPFAVLWAVTWRRSGRADAVTGGPTARALIVFGWGVSLTSNALLSPAFVFPLSAILGPLLAFEPTNGEEANGAAERAVHRP
jgi:O-antigen ligase